MKYLPSTIITLLAFKVLFLFSGGCKKEEPIHIETPYDTLNVIVDSSDSLDTDPLVPIPPFYYLNPLKPFPQHSQYAQGVILPQVEREEMDAKVISFYRQWRSRYLRALNDTQYYVYYTLEYKVNNAISCSEGHGFGMVITALMAGVDTTSYDDYIKLYNFYNSHRSNINSNLMAWQQSVGGINTGGVTSATDGDLDIAFSLLLAHQQWGSDGKVDFLKEADRIIEAIYKSDISQEYKIIELGDWVNGGKYAVSTRCCDFMFDHLRTFSNYSGETKWLEAIDTSYIVVEKAAHDTTGLLPDFVTINNGNYVACDPHFLEGPYDGDYYYNSCRAPWRIAMDYILFGDSRALETLNRLNKWIKEDTENYPHRIKGGYFLNGEPINTWTDMAFTAPFGVSAMVDAQHQDWLNAMWKQINKESITSGAYFGNSIKMLCLITMSGNWWTPY